MDFPYQGHLRRDVLDEILNLIESVSEDFPSYSFVMQWSFNLQNGIIIFFLTTNLLFSYNIEARHINFTLSKLNTNNTSFNLF